MAKQEWVVQMGLVWRNLPGIDAEGCSDEAAYRRDRLGGARELAGRREGTTARARPPYRPPDDDSRHRPRMATGDDGVCRRLRARGWNEGVNCRITYRFGGGDPDH